MIDLNDVGLGFWMRWGLPLVLCSWSFEAVGTDAQVGTGTPRTLAVFGSSVAAGGGDDEHGGYAGRLRTVLEARGWRVVNVSRGGDNTVTIAPRFQAELLPQKPGYVLIGLSLANEGLVGAVDDGRGHWVAGLSCDDGHPNPRGHEEMFYAIVPTLFDAVRAGKPVPHKLTTPDFARITPSDKNEPALTFTSDDAIHSFALAFEVRTGKDGVLTGVEGTKTRGQIEMKQGVCRYRSSAGKLLVDPEKQQSHSFHHVVLSHRFAKGETLFFVDGRLVGTIEDRLEPKRFSLGHTGGDYRDWLVYRSSLNADETEALHKGTLLHASLELYAPLREKRFTPGTPVINLAQSLSQAVTRRAGIQPVK